ncbi:ArsR/SmtB family transcription factor [Frateuria sp. GZRR35]|jgi:DNA-binding transcriptional ArsR family regulator|uniref:ArsR/SmtB family transcription factor n=1 Tax=Frateuria TaxID=70411 RepID=UPI002260913A|nr:metalloregulator ArsR/SmtB family transcription factor [Frateuria sp. STR12]MCX7514228.1 metalloregulator ArsR/SmtB family transcription factor [Frateuria sp. STR12]
METKTAVRALAGLAQDNRLGIFRYLVTRGPEGAVVGEISEHTGLSGSNLSFHLKGLVQAGLAESFAEGRYIRYRANFPAMRELIDYLTEHCCEGQPEQCRPPKCF